jgi:exonuclease III
LKCPEFLEFINNYDIIGVQESKLDDFDTIVVAGFEIFMHNRKEYSKHRSGGICVLVKKEIVNSFKILKSDSKLVLWFKLDLKDVNSEKHIVCGIVYIPPIRTKYANQTPI